MERRLDALQACLEGLVSELKDIRRRIEALEAQSGVLAEAPASVAADRVGPFGATHESSGTEAPEPAISVAVIPLLGRTLIILAGAFLLRAITPMTGTAIVPALGGTAAGLVYGAVWLLQADRAGAKGKRLDAAFHGFASAMITYPLIWETTTRFGVFPASGAACAVVVLFFLGLAVAWRHELAEIAWMAVFFSLATVTSLLIGTRDLMLFTAVILVVAVGVELIALRDRWLGLRWPVALALDMAVLLMVVIAVRPAGLPEGYAPFPSSGVVVIGLALPALYLSSIAVRSLMHERPVAPFEVVQAATALLVGLGGAVRVMRFNGGNPMPVAVVSLLLGAACYVVAFAFVDKRSGRGRNFYGYTTFAGLLTLVGSYMVLSGSLLALAWTTLALASVSLGGRFDRITLKAHGAIYLGAAALVAGLITCASDGLIAHWAGNWRPVTPLCSIVALAAAGCYGILAITGRDRAHRWHDLLPRATFAAAVVWISTGMAARWLSGALAAAPGPAADAAFVAAGRTAVLALAAVVLAWAGRQWSLRELTWLVYPVLVGGGIRLLLEDLRYGRPVTLFLTLALYGGALILTPRLIRTES